jgi:hypothetical protein
MQLPTYLKRGAVVLEETLFHEPLTRDMQRKVCDFLARNLGVVANGDLLLWAAVDQNKLLVQVELQHDQIYDAEQTIYGKLNVYVVHENG